MSFSNPKVADTKPANIMSAIVLAILLATGASGARAEERCSGTLCDLYYGNSAPQEQPATKPAARTPLTVPSLFSASGSVPANAPAPNGATTAPSSRIQVQGGGLLSLVRGQPTERCTGTLCDAFYGGSPPEKPEAPAAATQPSPDESVAAAEPDEAPPTSRRRRDYETVERETKPRCAATAQDPWRCYR